MAINVDDPVSEPFVLNEFWKLFICQLTQQFESLTNVCVALLVRTQELEAIKARVREMEEEAQKLSEMNAEVEKQVDSVQNEYG